MESFIIQELIFIYKHLFSQHDCKKHTFFWVALIYLLTLFLKDGIKKRYLNDSFVELKTTTTYGIQPCHRKEENNPT